MAEYRVTFGQKYRRELHPTFDEAHPDGWVTIVADDMDAARAEAVRRLGRAWGDIYSPESWEPEWFPAGELDRWEAP